MSGRIPLGFLIWFFLIRVSSVLQTLGIFAGRKDNSNKESRNPGKESTEEDYSPGFLLSLAVFWLRLCCAGFIRGQFDFIRVRHIHADPHRVSGLREATSRAR